MALPNIIQQINSKLPKSGGDLSGVINFLNTWGDNIGDLGGTVGSNNYRLRLTGGEYGWAESGGVIELFSRSNTGCVTIQAQDGTNSSTINITPNGAFTHNGNNVITSAGGTINGTLSIGGSLGVTGEINSTNGNIVATNGIVRGTRLSANNNVNDNIDFVFRHISDGGAYLPGSYARAGEWQAIRTIRGSWYSGINGYQIWSDGLIEQWGFAYAAHGGRFSFHTPFTSGNYCIYFQLENVDAHYIISAYDRQTTSCYTLVYWTTNYGTGTVPCYWYARGF